MTTVERATGTNLTFTAELMQYTSYTGAGQKSGAYIFRPVGAAASLTSGTSTFLSGALMSEVRHFASTTHIQAYRTYHVGDALRQSVIEARYRLGVLQPDREAIVRLRTSLNPATARLYSDNNAIEMRARKSPDPTVLPANYYPMVGQSALIDGEVQLALVSDRTVGVASMTAGQVELMLHRRCSQDDGRGMGEALDDQTIVNPLIWIAPGAVSSVSNIR